jgi:hypothetical protein
MIMELINKCIQKSFTNANDIHQYFKKIKFEDRIWNHQIFETNNTTNIICSFWETTTKPNSYFGNTDTNKNRMINGKYSARWKVIKKIMIENKINSITIKFCPIINNDNL